MRSAAALFATVVLAAACAGHPPAHPAAAVPSSPSIALPPSAEQAYQALARGFDGDGAQEIVSFMSQYWRLAGNPGFDASLDHIKAKLHEAGFPDANVSIETYPTARSWDYSVGTVAFDGREEPALLSKERDRVSLAINSFSTPDGGVTASLVDAGAGTGDAAYAGKTVKGAVVVGDASLGRLWQEAVKKRGAIGVISPEIASYIRPADPAEMTEQQKDVLQWSSIPYDEAVRGFGFKAPWRAVARMRERLAKGPVSVNVTIRSMFYSAPARTLVAEIPGRLKPEERIVLVAHVQEPGASDNASGCGTLYAIARAVADAVRTGAIPPPARTLTFMWLDEIRGSRQWMTAHPDAAKGVQYMFAMDMTGEDATKTGGTFLIEKQADPSAVWERPSDPHTEWGGGGGGGVRAESLKGSLLNDVHLAICLRRSRDTGWVVRTNPYEGGSDHTAFGGAGVPSLLDWHFTDRFYHTNQDTADKTSPVEMTNVGVAVATSAWFLASATPRDADAVVALLGDAAARRLALERVQGADLLARDSTPQAAATEQAVIAAWLKWYAEAIDSVLALPPAGADDALRAKVAAAKAALR